MSDALVKAISFITFIFIGLLLKNKFSSKDEINGLKKIILLLALPATIFVALIKVKLHIDLLFLPFIALAFNLVLFFATPLLLQILGFTNKPIINTAKLLIPSLAPGLSCFPFILEFLGEPYLAKAAMADLGNKFFVLFILYLVAIKWFYRNKNQKKESIYTKLKSLFKVMLFEPVNLFIILALILLFSGITLTDLPLFIQENLIRLSDIMTPLILLFIGLAVAIKRKQFTQIFSLLMLRYGLSLLLIGFVISVFDFEMGNDVLFMIAFALSACSFWPFAHISSIAIREKDLPEKEQTFNTKFALSVLALSLPLSVLLILMVFTAGNTFINPTNVYLLALFIILLGIALPFFKWAKNGAQIKNRYSKTD
ncbi:permease [Litoribaculum gwangyangense]|uniref:Permease n=1 Tax=Litoribaculum gwangyangense TaxID=1130722 RepID=A0ABP9CFJ2_9FLAO